MLPLFRTGWQRVGEERIGIFPCPITLVCGSAGSPVLSMGQLSAVESTFERRCNTVLSSTALERRTNAKRGNAWPVRRREGYRLAPARCVCWVEVEARFYASLRGDARVAECKVQSTTPTSMRCAVQHVTGDHTSHASGSMAASCCSFVASPAPDLLSDTFSLAAAMKRIGFSIAWRVSSCSCDKLHHVASAKRIVGLYHTLQRLFSHDIPSIRNEDSVA